MPLWLNIAYEYLLSPKSINDCIESAREIYASEENKGNATVKDGKLITSFKPYEIKSFALKLKKSSLDTQKVESTPLDLPFDKNIITEKGQMGDFEYTIPNTLVPDEIMANGVRYDINKSNKNSLICSAQRIKLDKDKNRLVFLCASMAGDKTAEFILGDKKIKKMFFRHLSDLPLGICTISAKPLI